MDGKGGENLMTERKHHEGEPENGSTSFIRPFQEKLNALWKWITFQEVSRVDTQVSRTEIQPRVEPRIPDVRTTPRYEAPRYTPRPRYESNRRASGGSSRRSSESNRSDSNSDSGWWSPVDFGSSGGGYDGGSSGCDGGGGGGGD